MLFAPPRHPCAPPGSLGRRGAIAMPVPWGTSHCCEAFFHISASVLSRPPSANGVTPAHSGPSCSSRLRRVGLVGLLRGPLPPRRGARSFVALPTVGTAVSLRGFLSAIAVFCCHGGRGFPLGAVAQGLPPCPHARTPATCTHYLSAPWGQGSSLAVLGACAPAPIAGGVFAAPLHPLRPRRGGRCFS